MKQKIVEEMLDTLKSQFEGVNEKSGYSYRYYHSLRVYQNCLKLIKMDWLKEMKFDKDALIVASIFHDIGKIKRINDKREIVGSEEDGTPHDILGEQIVGDFIGDLFETEFVDKVARIIGGHHGRNQTEFESKILHDADILDNQGVLTIWRNVAFSTQERRSIIDMLNYWKNGAREKAINKLNDFYFDQIKEIAKKRFEKIDELYRNLELEQNSEDY